MMEENTKFCDWTNTRKALDYLEELLQCRACLKTVNDPCTLGNCDHIFCRNCVQPFSGYCPKCKVPSHVKDVKPNRQIKVTLLHCKQMRTILGLSKTQNENNIVIDESEQQIQKEDSTTENDIHSLEENNITSSPNPQVITPKGKSPKKAQQQKSTEILTNDQPMMDQQSSSLNNLDQPIDKLQYASDKLVNTPVNDSVNDQTLDQTDGNITINADQLATVQKVVKSTLKMGQILLEKSHTSTPKNAKTSLRLKKAAKDDNETFGNVTVSSISPISPKMTTPRSQHLKRNALGETALHTSVIKGQVDDVRQLLAEGSNPNIKDNAGWSPLHEACNHGHLEIATILLDNGAIVNASGMDNVTPLHDAVSNNHLSVAELLITHGADLHLRNINGLTARDLATSKEMRRVLETTFPAVINNTNIAVNKSCDEMIILTTGLNGIQEQKLLKCAELLKAKVVKDFADNVTHLVTACNDNGVCARTIKFLNGILTGKWILKFEWIEACLLSGSREDDEKFEIKGCTTNLNGDGPRKGRLNHQMQHPGLFSGCQFYFRGNFSFPNPPKKHLEALVQKGQGVILSREPKVKMEGEITVPFHALPNSSISKCTYFVIYSQENVPRVKRNTESILYLPVSWLLDCVATFQIIDPTDSHM